MSYLRRLKFYCLLGCICFLGLNGIIPQISYAAPKTIWVSPSGDNANLGSELSPYETITFALGKVAQNDTIMLKGGIYSENVLILDLPEFVLKGASLIDTAFIEAPNPGPAIAITPVDSLPGRNMLIENLHVSHANLITGEAFRLINTSATIRNCYISYNTNTDSLGGAFYIESDNGQSKPLLENNIISNNSALSGAAVFVKNSRVEMRLNRIFRNSAVNSGGAIAVINGFDIDIYRNTMYKNAADSGAAIFIQSESAQQSINNLYSENFIYDNTALKNGGALYFTGNVLTSVFEKNILAENNAGNDGGAAAFESTTSVVFRENIVVGNKAVNNGGGIAFFNMGASGINLWSNTLTSNKAGAEGGGIFIDGASLVQIGGAANLSNNIYHNRDQSQLNNITSISAIGNLQLSQNYWGTTDQPSIAQQLSIPGLNSSWQSFKNAPDDVRIKFYQPQQNIWFADGKITYQKGEFLPIGDSTFVARTHPDSTFLIGDEPALLPKVYRFNWDNVNQSATDGQLSFFLDNSELNLLGNPFPLNLRILEKQGADWIAQTTQAFENGNIVSTPLGIFDNIYYTVSLDVNSADTLLFVEPRPNRHDVDKNDPLRIIFQNEMDPTSISSDNIKIHGSQSGNHPFQLAYTQADNSLLILPNDNLQAGETVTVTLTDAIKNINGDALLNGYSWQYNLSAFRGRAVFQELNPVQQRTGDNYYLINDFNGDLVPEWIEFADNELIVLNLNVDGTLQSENIQVLGASYKFMRLADINDDDINEIILFNDADIIAYSYSNTTGFTEVYNETINTGSILTDILVKDFNNDGVQDFALLRDFVGIFRQIDFQFGSFSPSFTLTAGTPVTLNGASNMLSLVDWNANGLFDIVASNGSANSNLALVTNQKASFNSLIRDITEINAQTVIKTGNVWNDIFYPNQSEIIVAGAAAPLNLLKLFNTDEDGLLVETHRREYGNPIQNVAVADLNSDGYGDLIVALDNGDIDLVYSNNDGILANNLTVSLALTPQEIITTDFDADGDIDLFLYEQQDGSTAWQILENASREPRTWWVNSLVSNGDGSFDKPFNKINDALAKSFSGDSILVFPARYNENITIKHDLFLSANDTAKAIIGTAPTDQFSNARMQIVGAIKFTLENFSLEDDAIKENSIGLFADNLDSINIRNVAISGFDQALNIQSSSAGFNDVRIKTNNNGVLISNSEIQIVNSSIDQNLGYGIRFENSNAIIGFSNFQGNFNSAFTDKAGVEILDGSFVSLNESSVSQNGGSNILIDNSNLQAQFVFIGEAKTNDNSTDGYGILARNNAIVDVQNSLIADNHRIGIAFDNSQANILNSLIANNDSLGIQNGGGLFIRNSSNVDLRNSILLANNTAINNSASTVIINYNDFYQNKTTLNGASFGEGNLNVDPLLVFMYNQSGEEIEVDGLQQLKLAAGSQLIDRGDPELTNGNSASRSDIGIFGNLGLPYAFETIPAATIVNEDSSVTLNWQALVGAESDLLASIAIFRDINEAFIPDTSKLVASVGKGLTSYIDKTLQFGQEYYYRLAFVDTNDGAFGYSDAFNARIDFSAITASLNSIFVQLGQGDSLVRPVSITNDGTIPVTINVQGTIPEWLTVSPQQHILQSGDIKEFVLTFNAKKLPRDSLFRADVEFVSAENALVKQVLDIELLVSYRDLSRPQTVLFNQYPDTIRQASLSFIFSANDSVNSSFGTPTSLLRYIYTFSRISDATPTILEMDTTSKRRLDFYPLENGQYRFEVAAIDTANNGSLGENSQTVILNLKAGELPVISKFWQLVTVPRKVLDSGVEFNPEAVESLRHWQDEMYAYVTPDSVLPGRSYWIFTTKKLEVDLNRFPLVSSTTNFEVPLQSGWNMIGNPWSWNILWANLTFTDTRNTKYTFKEAVDNQLINSGIYSWQVTNTSLGYQLETSDKMSLNSGYWLKIKEPLTLSYNPSPYINFEQSFSKSADDGTLNEGDALLQLMVKHGRNEDNDNYFGVCANINDHPFYFKNAQEPPAIFNNVRLFNRVEGNDFATNLKEFSASDSVQNWDLVVAGNVDNEKKVLSWKNLNPDSPINFYLYHLESGSWFNIKEQQTFVIENNSSENHFKLYATDDISFQPEILPTEFKLSQNFPNPFNPSTTIKLAIPYFADKENVKLDIFDVLGRKVTNLVNRRLKSGEFKVTWNGTNSFGRKVASGIYFYKLSAKDFNASRKMILLR